MNPALAILAAAVIVIGCGIILWSLIHLYVAARMNARAGRREWLRLAAGIFAVAAGLAGLVAIGRSAPSGGGERIQ